MTKEELHKDMEEMLGPVSSAFEQVPEGMVEQEWALWKKWEMYEGSIPQKWRQLISLAVAATSGNDIGAVWRTEMAKQHGATEEEIKETLFCVKNESSWAAYNTGAQVDVEKFKSNAPQAVKKVNQYIESKERAPERASM